MKPSLIKTTTILSGTSIRFAFCVRLNTRVSTSPPSNSKTISMGLNGQVLPAATASSIVELNGFMSNNSHDLTWTSIDSLSVCGKDAEQAVISKSRITKYNIT
ncbi:MAG: hypothetical protein LWW98_11960 [Deltaproteobacteria bacterium]|nr:hypothetical protein [Deltaproteobacteria bacterium]